MRVSEFKYLFYQILMLIKKTVDDHNCHYFISEKDKIKLQQFLEALGSVITDSCLLEDSIFNPKVNYVAENISFLLEDEKIKCVLGELPFDSLILFEMILYYVNSFDSPNLALFFENLRSNLASGLVDDELQLKRFVALCKINEKLKLGLVLESTEKVLVTLNQNKKTLADLVCRLEAINDEADEIKKIKEKKEQRLSAQYKLLEFVSDTYCNGSYFSDTKFSLKKHNYDEFMVIFGKYLDYNQGTPKFKQIYKNDLFDFEVVLYHIFANCASFRNCFTSYQCGELALFLKSEVNQKRTILGVEITQGDLRKNIPFVCAFFDKKPSEYAFLYWNLNQVFNATLLIEKQSLKNEVQVLIKYSDTLVINAGNAMREKLASQVILCDLKEEIEMIESTENKDKKDKTDKTDKTDQKEIKPKMVKSIWLYSQNVFKKKSLEPKK